MRSYKELISSLHYHDKCNGLENLKQAQQPREGENGQKQKRWTLQLSNFVSSVAFWGHHCEVWCQKSHGLKYAAQTQELLSSINLPVKKKKKKLTPCFFFMKRSEYAQTAFSFIYWHTNIKHELSLKSRMWNYPRQNKTRTLARKCSPCLAELRFPNCNQRAYSV